MTDIEQIINCMREQGAVNNLPPLQIGTMTGPYSCRVGDLNLGADDLYFAEHLLYNICREVIVEEQTKYTENYTVSISIPDGGGTDTDTHRHQYNSVIKDKSKYLSPLKSGDLVLVLPYSDSRYIVIEKLISSREVQE
jgi:hypothetical protein